MKIQHQPFYNYLFSDFPPDPDLKVSIVIPVKDEEKYIKKTLAAFALQVDGLGLPLKSEHFEILILANNCSDRSVEFIKDFQIKNSKLHLILEEITLLPHHANIGHVRRLLMDAAYKRLSQNSGGIIMTTDADTQVASNWIAQNKIEVENGADAVGGRILLCPEEVKTLDGSAYFLHCKDEQYQLLVADLEAKILQDPFDAAPKHHQHFNGSFAITTEFYERSGGIPEVEHLEDCAFFEKLKNMDAKVRHSHKVIVHTSARCIGRTEIGLSYQLNVWKNLGMLGADFFVESSESVIERLTLKKQLRYVWKNRHTDSGIVCKLYELIHEFSNNKEHFDFLESSVYFGEWYSHIFKLQEKYLRGKYPYEPIESAIEKLQEIIEIYSESAFSQTSMR